MDWISVHVHVVISVFAAPEETMFNNEEQNGFREIEYMYIYLLGLKY